MWLQDLESLEAISQDSDTRELVLRMAELSRTGHLAPFLVQEAVRRRRSRFDALLAGGYDRARALSGYAGASLRTWSRTGCRVARLRLQAHALLRERREAQFELGGAAYAGDAKAFGDMID